MESSRRVSVRASGKVCSLDELIERRLAARAEGKRVVHCHGCFDIVHPGHIRHLRFAKAQGDILLVTITSDGGVGKGPGRPLIPHELRAENLSELDCVDWVHVDTHATAAELLGVVEPDVYIKGSEYEFNRDPRFKAERETVERSGGRVVFSSGDIVFSSSALIHALEHSVDPFGARLTRLLEVEELGVGPMSGLVERFRGKRVLVVGDVILDSYVFCDRPTMADESPVMTLRPMERREYDGGAAIVARHMAALGARPVLVTGMPEGCERAMAMSRRLAGEGVEVRSIAVDGALPEKQRYLVGAQKVMKVDLVEPRVLDAGQQDRLVALTVESAKEMSCDAAVVADFGLGLLSPTVIGRLCGGLRPVVGVLSGDVSGRQSGLMAMRGMDLVCPSEDELRTALGNFGDSLPAVAWQLLEGTGAKAALVTMGAEGLIGFGRLDEGAGGDGWQSRVRGEHVPALVGHAVDALGCGDALLSAATLALASGSSLLAASMLGAAAAAIESRRIGNVPVLASDLRREITRLHASHMAFTTAEAMPSGRLTRAVREAS